MEDLAPQSDMALTEPTDEPTDRAMYPSEHSLCESCGYALRGLHASGDCPECGTSIETSCPDRRSGLPWQLRMRPAAWLQTARLMAFSPGRAFEMMSVSDTGIAVRVSIMRANGRARLFLFSVACMIGCLWFFLWRTAQGPQPLRWAFIAFGSLVLLTYIEAAGVAYLARRRGWRVTRLMAERIACFAAVGWIPAGVVLLKLFLWHVHPAMRGPFDLFHGDARDYPWLVSGGAMSILWFEWLVWFGCRRLKFANCVS